MERGAYGSKVGFCRRICSSTGSVRRLVSMRPAFNRPGLARGCYCGRPTSISCSSAPLSEENIKMRSSCVTTAVHPVPKVTACAVAPSGISKFVGSTGVVEGAGNRVRKRAIRMIIARIITPVRTVTRRRRKPQGGWALGGVAPSSVA